MHLCSWTCRRAWAPTCTYARLRTHMQRNNTFCFSTAAIIRERASMLCYTSIVSPVSARYNIDDCVCVSFFCSSYYIDLHRHTTHVCVFFFENQIGACFILDKKPRSSSNSEMSYLIVSMSALKNADIDTICGFFSWTRRWVYPRQMPVSNSPADSERQLVPVSCCCLLSEQ
jgi:hypothetical protein